MDMSTKRDVRCMCAEVQWMTFAGDCPVHRTPRPGEGVEESLLARIQELRAENERLRAERDRFESRVVDYVHALGQLRALIDKHNDECRECPVIDA